MHPSHFIAETNRVEYFSDAVFGIIITIMVLELHPPELPTLESLSHLLPTFLAYVLSFAFIGVYWNNHHHMMLASPGVTGGIMWANLHLLFWISLIPFTTAWMGAHHTEALPVALYGVVLLMGAIAYFITQSLIIWHQGKDSALAKALGRNIKGKISPALYAIAIVFAFISPWVSFACFIAVAVMWMVPDKRIERALRETRAHS